jgi:hypothetical protein
MEKYQAVGLICSASGVGLGMVLLLSSVAWETLLEYLYGCLVSYIPKCVGG